MARFFLLPIAAPAQAPPASDWPTWATTRNAPDGTEPKRRCRKRMFPDSCCRSAQLPIPPREIALSTLTAPLVVQGVTTSQGRRTLLFVVGSEDTVFAIDADSGRVVWQKAFPNSLTPPQIATWLCSNTQNATPVIDKQKGIIYLNTSDGKLRGLSLSTGDERVTPTEFVTPFARNWSLNLIDDVIYSPTARGCGGAIANISAMDVSDPAHPRLSRLYTSGGRPAGAWGRGVVKARGHHCANGRRPADPAAGSFGNTVMTLAPKEWRIVDSFTPSNWRVSQRQGP